MKEILKAFVGSIFTISLAAAIVIAVNAIHFHDGDKGFVALVMAFLSAVGVAVTIKSMR